MVAGRLGALNCASQTNEVVYSNDINDTTTAVINLANRGGGQVNVDVAVKDYTQQLTLDANTYDFQKGNVVSKYKIELNPGLTVATADPGLAITGDQGNWSAKIGDVVRTTTTTSYNVVVGTTGEVTIDSASIAGTFQGGETLNAQTSGLAPVYRGATATGFAIELAQIAAGDTSLPFSDVTNFTAGDYFVLSDSEVLTVTSATFYTGTTGGGTVVVGRGALGTTAVAHDPGQYVTAYTPSPTTTTINEGAPFAAGDTTLTVVNGAAILSGSYIVIGNEVLFASAVNGNDVTVTRGNWGTTDAQHADGATVTPLSAAGSGAAKWFDGSGEALQGAISGAGVNTQGAPTITVDFTPKFMWSATSGQEIVQAAFSLDVDRTYEFDLSDASNTGLPFRFSDVSEGTNATPTPGIEYTTGVTKVGTPGSAGCTITIEVSDTTPSPLYYYADGTAGYSGSISVESDPTFTEVYVYDVVGTPVTGNTFLVGTAAQAVGTVTPGAFGYVTAWDSTGGVLKVFVDNDSPAYFAATDTFPDTPPEQGATRALATVNSVTQPTDLDNEDYIAYKKIVGANDYLSLKGVVLGPCSHVIVWAAANQVSAQVSGFVNQVNDYTIIDYIPPAAGIAGGAGGDGGGGAPAPNP